MDRDHPSAADQARPGSEKPQPKPVDRAYLQRAALAYLERYATSVDNLRRVLLRKARRRLGPGAQLDETQIQAIEEVIAAAGRMDLVDDSRFALGRVTTLLRRGTSRRAMKARLVAKGVDGETIDKAIADAGSDDDAAARRLAQRRRLGPWRVTPDPDRRDRDLAALARAGFSFDVARRVIDGERADRPPD